MISVIIPVHNEESHLYESVRKFFEGMKDIEIELILVENGSTDNTLQVCDKLKEDLGAWVHPLSLLKPSYGEAIRTGVRQATGEYVFVLEADYLSVKFVKDSMDFLINDQYKMVVASKRHSESIDKRTLKRRFLTWGFNLLLRVVFGFKGTDTHGLKAFKRESAKMLFEMAETGGEALQTEIVLLANLYDIPVKEIPIMVEEARNSPVSITRRVPKVWHAIHDIRRSMKKHRRLVKLRIK